MECYWQCYFWWVKCAYLSFKPWFKMLNNRISSNHKESEIIVISRVSWNGFSTPFIKFAYWSAQCIVVRVVSKPPKWRGCPGVPVNGGIPIVFISIHGVVTQFVNVSFLCVPVHEDTTKMADNFLLSSSFNSFTNVSSNPNSPKSSRMVQKKQIVIREFISCWFREPKWWE